ncbi:MAG: cyclic pyranopterin phosphate synthase [Candidatus Azotimanducaceae bacterium]|jgi:cyclic pyranopterin phosphate synthase
MIVDRLGRQFKNLRVSLTAACNFACTYCVPDGKRLMKAKSELAATELLQGVKLLQQAAGIDKIRITGGEPLVTPKFDDFLLGVMQLPLRDVSMTTNGQLLLKKRDVIVESGIKRLNVSLDTLDPINFKEIARGGDLKTVLAGMDAMLDAGIKLKVNMVPLRSKNAHQVVPMLDYCLNRGIELRYIELMQMGHLLGSNAFHQDFLSMEALLDLISEKYEFARTDAPYDSTAVRFEIPGQGIFGIIANESEPFCRSCTRLRLSSDGNLYGCLSSSRSQYIGDLFDQPSHLALPKLQKMLLSALGDKQLAFQGETTVMKFIGG